MTDHSFDAEVATEHGVICALLVHHFQFWIRKNISEGQNLHDGRTWSYTTRQGLMEIFPYLTENQIRGAVDRLVSAGILLVANYNKAGFDRTKWYAFNDEGYWVKPLKRNNVQKPPMQPSESTNATCKNHQPIPDTKTDIKVNPPTPLKGALTREMQAEFETWWKLYPEKTGKKYAAKCFKTARKEASLEQLISGLQTYIATKPPDRAWCHPSTWLNQGRWADEVGPRVAGNDGVTPETLSPAARKIYDQMIADGAHAAV